MELADDTQLFNIHISFFYRPGASGKIGQTCGVVQRWWSWQLWRI